MRLPSANTRAAASMENKEVIRQASLLGPAIAAKVTVFAKRASVFDAKFREDVLIRIVGVHDMFVSLFSDGISSDSTSNSDVRRVEDALCCVLRCVSVAQPLALQMRLLSNVCLQDAYARCREAFSRQRSSIFYVLQHNLVAPILDTQDSLFSVMGVLVQETQSHDLRRFQCILAWAAAAWEGVLSVSDKTTTEADEYIIVDFERMLRLERDLTLNQLCRHVETPVDELLRMNSQCEEAERAGNALVTSLTAKLERAREESRKQSRNATDSDDDIPENDLSRRQRREVLSEGKYEEDRPDRAERASVASAEEELSLAKEDLADQRRRTQKDVFEKMSAVASVYEASEGWKRAQNVEQLIVLREIQHILCVWNGLDKVARSDLVGPPEDLEHTSGTCPFTATLQGASAGALNSPLLQIPVYLAAFGGGEEPHAAVLKGSSAEILHVRVANAQKTVLLRPGQVKIIFLLDHFAAFPVTAVLLHCADIMEKAGSSVRSVFHIAGRYGCDRQKKFVSEMLENFGQDYLCSSVVATDELVLEELSSAVGSTCLKDNIFRVLSSLAACRLQHACDLRERESSAPSNFFVGERVLGDGTFLRQEIDKRLRVLRSLPERSTLTSTNVTEHKAMEIFQSVEDAIQHGLRNTLDPSATYVKVLRRLQLHLKQQAWGARQAELHLRAEQMVPKSPFERARLVDFLVSEAHAFPNISEPMLAVINHEPYSQTIVDRSRCAAKLLKSVQRLLAFIAKFQRASVNASSVAEIGGMHDALLPLVYRFRYNLVGPVVRAVLKEDDNLVIAREVSQSYFVEKQAQLDDLLHRMGVPSGTREKFGLSTILSEIAESLPAATVYGEAESKTHPSLTQRSSKALESIARVQQNMAGARGMASPPRHLIAALNKHLEELKASDRLGLSNEDIKMREVAVDNLCSKLVEYGATLNAEDPVLSKLPKELHVLKSLCGQVPHAVRTITGVGDETNARGSKPDNSESSSASATAKIALEMVAERNGILKLVDLVPTTRDATARRGLQRQAIKLMLPALGSEDVEPHTLRRDVLLASAGKRAQSLIDKSATSLLGDVSGLEEYFQISPKGGDLTTNLQNTALSDVVGMVSDLHSKRLNVLNIANSFDGETVLRVCPVSLSLVDVFGLTAIACPAIIEYCVRLQAAADSTLSRSFGSGEGSPPAVELPRIPPELSDADAELALRTDLCRVSLVDDANKADMSRILLNAMITIRKVVHQVLVGGDTSEHRRSETNPELSERPSEDTRLRPRGIVSATDEWIPLQTFFCCVLIEICRNMAEKSMNRKDLAGMLAERITHDQTLTAAVRDQKAFVDKCAAKLQRHESDIEKRERELNNCSAAGTAVLRRKLEILQSEVKTLTQKLRRADRDHLEKEEELNGWLDAQVQKGAEKLHDSIKSIFSHGPLRSKGDTLSSAEALYEDIVTLPSCRRETLFEDLCDASDASLRDIAQARRLLLDMIDRTSAAQDLLFMRLQCLLDVCTLAMCGIQNTARCLKQYLVTVETSGGLMRDFVAGTAPCLDRVFIDLERVLVEARKDCSDFDALERHTLTVLGSLDNLRDDERTFWYERSDNTPSCAEALRSVSHTARVFCIRAVFASLADVRGRQLHSAHLDECYRACRREAVRLNDQFLLALTDNELVVELDLLRHQRVTVQAALRGIVLHAAFGIASSPFELVCALQRTIGTVDVQALAPAYATQLLVKDWLKPMDIGATRAASRRRVDAATTLGDLMDVLAPVSHLRVIKDDSVINSGALAHDFLVEGVSRRVEAIAQAVTFLDGKFTAWGAGHVDGVLRLSGDRPSPEQAEAAGRLSTVFQALVGALIRQLLLMCSNTVRQQVAATVAGLQPLKDRLHDANTRLLITDGSGPKAAFMLNNDVVLLVDSLRAHQRREGEGDIAHLDILQLEMRSEARFPGVTIPDAENSGLAAAETLSDLLYVGTMDMCGPLQLLLKSTLDVSTCCDMLKLYLAHALECVEALYSPLADVMVSGEIKRAHEGHTKLLQKLFKAEDIFVGRIVHALRQKALNLLPRPGTNDEPESNYYHETLRRTGRATELAEDLLAEGEEMLQIKYASKQADFDRELARIEATYSDWLKNNRREDAQYRQRLSERSHAIASAEREVNALLSGSNAGSSGREAPDAPHTNIVKLLEKRTREPAVEAILGTAIADHYEPKVSHVSLRLECAPLVRDGETTFRLDKVNARVDDGEESPVYVGVSHGASTRFWDFLLPLECLDPENQTRIYLVRHWVQDLSYFAVVILRQQKKAAVLRAVLRLTKADIADGVKIYIRERSLSFECKKGEDIDQGQANVDVRAVKTWTPKDSIQVAESCPLLWRNIEKAVACIPQEPKRPRQQRIPESPDEFRDKYGTQLEK